MKRIGLVEAEQLPYHGSGKAQTLPINSIENRFTQYDGSIEVAPYKSACLKGFAEYKRWSSVSLLFCRTDPLSISWPLNSASRQRSDFHLFRVSIGEFRIVHQGVSQSFSAGDLILISNGAALKLYLETPASFTLMSVPKELLPSATRNLDRRPLYKIENQTPALSLLTAYQDFLRGKEHASSPTLEMKVGQHLVDLMTVSLASTSEKHAYELRPGREARLDAIKSDILANLSQVRLSAKTAARRHGVTDRYIHKLFEETGETFGRFVTEERLKRAHKLLTTPHYSAPISTIAFEVGFGELSTFNRAFKKRFGHTPSVIRRKHMSEGSLMINEQKR